MSYAFHPFNTGLVAHIGGLCEGEFFVESRPCIGFVTQDERTVLAVLDRDRGYEVESLHDVLVSSPDAVIVAVLPAGSDPTPAQLAQAEVFSRRCAARIPTIAPPKIGRKDAA